MTPQRGSQMWTIESGWFERLDTLFGSLVREEYDEFLAGCSDDLVLNARGSTGLATNVSKSGIPEWCRSTRDLSGSGSSSSVCFILVEESVAIVVLAHTIERDGASVRYETVNRCTLRAGLLATWFSYPLNVEDYAEAWELRRQTD